LFLERKENELIVDWLKKLVEKNKNQHWKEIQLEK